MLLFGAGNLDPERFPEPHRFERDRRTSRSAAVRIGAWASTWPY